MFVFNPRKLLLLSLISTFIYATAIEHVHFSSNSTSNNRSIDLIFANGFEAALTGSYSSDSISPITDIPAIETGSAKVGGIAGSFQTDQMGQANYSIPILAGAGTAGLAPQISLNYSSGSGNGSLGVGWSLSGITIITRCRETEESRDEDLPNALTPQPITWDTDDKLCLNGERLYLVTGANYWDDSSTYRTERDQFARITYIDASESFSIQRKDGSIAYYGDTTDSNIQASDVSGSPTYAWAISRFVDNMDNYIDYNYTQFADLEFVLSDIDYTGHLGGHAPYNNLHFSYDSMRSDKTISYIAGAKIAMTNRLNEISSSIDGTQVRTYALSYDVSDHSSRSILNDIEECRGSNCLPKTLFSWSQPAITFKTSSATAGNFPSNIKSSKLGDINADGRADLVIVDDNVSKFKVAYGQGEAGFSFGAITNIPVPTGSEIDNLWHLIDYNADGRQDLMIQNNANNWVIHLAGQGLGGLSAVAIDTGLNADANSDFQIVDMNGDGLADLLHVDGAQLQVRYLQKNGSSYEFSSTQIRIDLPNTPSQTNGITNPSCPIGQLCFNQMSYKFFTDDELNIRVHDINGDGVADLMLRSDVLQTIIALQGNEETPYEFVSANHDTNTQGGTAVHLSSHWIAFVGNGINGSGDLDYRSEHYYITQATSLGNSADKDIKFIDINADGLSDVLKIASVDNWQYKLSNGTGFEASVNIAAITNSDHLQLFDYNNDGYIDMVYPNNDVNKTFYRRLWTGDGFSSFTTSTGAQANNLTSTVNLFMDANGDGREDHLHITSSGLQKIYIREDTLATVDKITTIQNGLQNTTLITYKPLTFSSTYNQGNQANTFDYGNNSPVFDYMSSMYVVRSVTTDTPTQDNNDETTEMLYQYANARVQTGGRGFLGFEKIITSIPVRGNEGTNKVLQTTTTYSQEYPFIGLPISSEVIQTEVEPDTPIGCGSDDSCFPPPCDPGEICFDPLRNFGSTILLSKTTNSFDKFNTDGSLGSSIGKAQFAYINTTIEETYAPSDETLLKTRIQTTTHDDFGNPLTNTVKIYNGSDFPINLLHTTTTTNTYTNNTTNWKIGLLETTSTTVSRPNQTSNTTTIQYDYNLTTGLLSEERREPNADAEKFLRILHQYDNFGNEIKTISCSGDDFTTSQCANTTNLQVPDASNPTLIHRYNELVFDSKGRYVNHVKNSLNQIVSTITSRDIYGNPKTTLDLLGTTTTNSYNVFGQAESSYSSLGSWSSVSKKWCSALTGSNADNSCPANATIRVTNRASGGSLGYAFIDKLGRTISSTARSFNNSNTSGTVADERWISNDQYYDNLGRSVKAIGPYFYGETNTDNIPETTTEYDRYNRATKITLPDTAEENISYTDFITITTNDLGQSRRETKNALGEIIESQDDSGTKLFYFYNSQGLVTEIKRSVSGVTELLTKNTYDKLGRKTTSHDVDTGTTTSDYNAEGEIIKIIDAKFQSVRTYRDELGRVELTENFNNTGIKKLSTEQIYNPTTNQIQSEIEHLGADAFTRDYVYDSHKRLSSITTSFIDTQNVCDNFGTCQYTNTIYYDQYSRSKIEQDASREAIKNNYNAQGFLEKITNAENPSQQYYKINNTDNRGNIIQDTKAANLVTDYSFDQDRGFMTDIQTTGLSKDIYYNYSYDTLGNLRKRADIRDLNNNLGYSECFYYDNLNRLREASRHNSFGVNCTAPPTAAEQNLTTYDKKGNITRKDNQDYDYLNASPNTIGNSPHQVQDKGNQHFDYDANGNNTLMSNFQSANGTFQNRNIQYTIFNKVDRLWLGNDPNNPLAEASYKYDTTRQKYARIDTENGESTVTYFIGNVEVEYNKNGQIAYKRQLGNYAIITETNQSTQETYLFTDHLGSVDTITDEKGNILQKMSFSAWGERRLPNNWESIPLPTVRDYLSDYTTRGFTGHEMVDTFGIINMGGRIYSPDLGRVLQADPFVQDPTNTQSFNRYTYVFNNPLSYTDPSGYFSWKKFFKIGIAIIAAAFIGGIAGGFVADLLGFSSLSASITGAAATLKSAIIVGAVTGATAAFVSVGIITGNLKMALKAGLSGAVLGAAFAGITYGINSLAWFDASHAHFSLNSNVELSIPQRVAKVLAQATTAGLASEIKGDGFNQGFKYSIVTVALGEVAQFARYRASISSAKNPLNIQGQSSGFQGDGLKLAGGRQQACGNTPVSCSLEALIKQPESPLGGTQGLQGKVFGIPYKPGGIPDFINETYAGPHDQLNSWYWYDQIGNTHVFKSGSFRALFGGALNYFDVALSTPAALSSLVQVYNPAITLYVRELGYQ